MKSTKMLNYENVKFLCGLIRDVATIDSAINDLAIGSDMVFSSKKVTELARETKHSLEQYVQSSINGLTHLKKKIVDTLPSDADAEDNILYLVKDTSVVDDIVYNQYLLIDGKLELLGRTSTDISNYYTRDEVDARFALLSSLQTLIDMVGNASDLETTAKDTLVNAINSLKEELDEKEVVKEITWDEYQALSEEEKNNGTRYDIPDMPTGGADDFLRESDITTVLDSTVTNKQVVGAKALYDELLKGRVIFKDLPQGTDVLAWAESLPELDVSQVYFARCFAGTNVPSGTTDGFFMARRIPDEKWIGITMWDIRTTNTYEIRMLDGVWGKWKCSKCEIPNASGTIPIPNTATYDADTKIVYSIIDGICYIFMWLREFKGSDRNITIQGFPKSKLSLTGSFISEHKGRNGIYTFGSNYAILHGVPTDTGDNISISFSYPVADDWRP